MGFDILRSLRIRSKGINFIACPSCSRQNFDVVKTMNELEVLSNVFDVGGNEVFVDEDVARRAMVPLRRMLDFSAQLRGEG